VHYQQAMVDAITAKVPAMRPVDQIGLLQDATALGIAGYAPASNILEIAASVPATADPIVWQRIVRKLGFIDSNYSDTPQRAAFRRYAIALIEPALATLGTTPKASEPANVTIARAELTETLGGFGDSAIVAKAKALVAQGSGTPAEQRSALTIAAQNADPAFFDMLLARARATNDPLEKLHLYTALAGVEDPALSKRMIDIGLSNEVPAGSNINVAFTIAFAHPDLAWSEIVPRLDAPEAGIDQRMRWLVAGGVAGLSSDLERIADIQAYAEKNIPEDAREPIKGSIASIKARHRIVTDVLPELDRWIAAHPS
jgi:aminopeptidase N